MASKGPRSKLDHESRAKRQKALEAPKEPWRPKTHWDHVLEEMVWLSKDFESERKWKLAQAKKVSIRASKGFLDQATRGEKRLKEEEQRLRKVALSISKDVKKFWAKIEKLVLYKHQLELDEKKKKALDKQLEFLLGQTERYSSMLAENLVGAPTPCKSTNPCSSQKQLTIQWKKVEDNNKKTPESDSGSQTFVPGEDEDFNLKSDDESGDDERTLEEDESFITKEEREEELKALHSEIDLPLDEILKRYSAQEVSREKSVGKDDNALIIREVKEVNGKVDIKFNSSTAKPGRRCNESNGVLSASENHSPHTVINHIALKNLVESPKRQILDELNEEEDDDFELSAGEEKDHDMDDETTLIEEEELADSEPKNNANEIALLHKESEVPIEELIARYKEGCDADVDMEVDSESVGTADSEESMCSLKQSNSELKKSDDVSDSLQPESCPVVEDVEEAKVENLENFREDMQSEDIMANAAAAARSAQPTGNTFSTTKVRTKFPFLLKFPLREYQHIGLDWLVTMYEKRLNGILADEMGLGKTIMTIALVAHLACEKGIWGPHLIVVPTSVMLNWETEFLKWCPAFKILTYFGSAKERRIKRQGWMKTNSFHVCITTYRLVIQDSKVFKRKKWRYLILDEAHLIKNWKSQRWQTLLNFNSKRRILLTGTPLQNDLMELWSLMHFLMPHIFQSHQEFKDWFSNPISGMVEGQDKVNKEVVDRLHNVLRPFILRRLKRDVEKQLPKKHEHVIFCRLSKRQRNLYEDFIANSETQATLASANFFGMISVIMQLRKVCNHPDLFEGRPIISSYDMSGINVQLSYSVCSMLASGPFSAVDLSGLGFVFTHLDLSMTSWENEETQAIATPSSVIEQRSHLVDWEENPIAVKYKTKMLETNIFEDIRKALLEDRQREAKERAAAVAWWNTLRCRRRPIYSTGLRELVTVKHPIYDIHRQKHSRLSYIYSSKLAEIVMSPVERFEKMVDQVESFMFAIPAARAPWPVGWCSKGGSPVFILQTYAQTCSQVLFPLLTPYRSAIVRRQVYFPDRRLIQFDCGKLQELAVLLRKLKSEGHRALIFTQMTKMLDILETFINIYGYTYMRLDGSTQPEERQTLMQRFNTNPKIFLFILSTRSGGVGINLVGADTVIFYDSDWNPAMDQQAQDRCHRIGQTREVHIYRLISESTIEENILKKANQKRALDNLVIQSGSYNTEFFKKLDPMELFSVHERSSSRDMQTDKTSVISVDMNLSSVDLEAALKNAEDEADYMALKKVEEEEAVENQEFTEEAVGKLEDDELVNEDEMKLNDDEMKPNDPLEHNALVVKSEEHDVLSHPVDDEAIDFSGREDDIDMLADVKLMAAAAAASGQAVLSFENHLRPIDRYAIRFLELWNPIVDKAANDSHIQVEEKDWELEHIEKLKDDMEAENDDDEEPLIYESWNADFATEIYRQQVEELAQQKLLEDMEREAQEKDALENGYPDSPRNDVLIGSKPKTKKKPKKAKFKSLKKGSMLPNFVPLKEDSSSEQPMLIDDDQCFDDLMISSDISSPCSVQHKKRKCASEYEDVKSGNKSKKLKSSEQDPILLFSKSSIKHANETKDIKVCENGITDLDSKQIGRIKIRGKLSISLVPLKLNFTMKPEKIKKKGSIWSLDYIPFPDLWSPHEDAVLCAAVREYGPNWNLASEILRCMTAGGFYRGRSRHPLHCSERFRELVQKHILSVSDATNNDKSGSIGSGKALLKVTEDNIHALLGIVSQLPDHEPLLQKHFCALLSAAWRDSWHSDRRNKTLASQSGFYPSHKSLSDEIDDDRSTRSSQKLGFTNLNECGKLVASALDACCSYLTDERSPSSVGKREVLVAKERLDLSLEPQGVKDEVLPLPSVIYFSIFGPEPLQSSNMHPDENQDTGPFCNPLKNPFKTLSSRMPDEGDSREFPTYGTNCSTSQLLNLGIHKLPVNRTSKDLSDSQNHLAGEVFPLMPPIPTDYYCMGIDEDLSSPFFPEAGDLEFESLSLDMHGEVASLGIHEINQFASLPYGKHELDDFSELPDFTDIG